VARAKLLIVTGACVALGAASVPLARGVGARATCAGATVKVADHMTYAINRYVQDGMRFAPGTVTIKSGCDLTFAFATTDQAEAHSLSIVAQSDLPKTTAQMQNCKVCGQIAAKHVKHAGQPAGPTNPVVHWIVNVGRPGLDALGDSLVIAEKGAPAGHHSVTIPVSAHAGTTLYFMCGLHPWMQGKIVVK
jgi:plastocyanin